MKRLIDTHIYDDIFGMANLNPNKSGLSVIIWADHSGITRNVSHKHTPRVKIGLDDIEVSVSISATPKILAKNRKNIKKSDMAKIQQGIDYVARNYYTFLKHYSDTDFSFDDEDLFAELREKGQYK